MIEHSTPLGLGRSKPFPITSPCSRQKDTFLEPNNFPNQNLQKYPGESNQVQDIGHDGQPRISLLLETCPTLHMSSLQKNTENFLELTKEEGVV